MNTDLSPTTTNTTTPTQPLPTTSDNNNMVDEMTTPFSVAKRGRKPKQQKDEKNSGLGTGSGTGSGNGTTLSRKKTQPIAEREFGINNFGKDDTFTTENLILHLKISSANIPKNDSNSIFLYNPTLTEPVAYENSSFSSYPFTSNQLDNGEKETYLPYTSASSTGNELIESNTGTATVASGPIQSTSATSIEHLQCDNQQKYTDKPCTLLHDNQTIATFVREISVECTDVKIAKNTYPILPAFDNVQQQQTQSSNQTNTVTTSTYAFQANVCCWWCCHLFSHEPFVVPINLKNGIFEVIGYFSSPECCAAFIFDQGYKYGDINKQYQLLHLLYSKIVNGEISRIKIALPRETLKMFGGPYTIEQYRALCDNYYIDVKISRPPFIYSNGIVEETIGDVTNKKKIIPMDKDRVQKATDELKLKRLKKRNTECTLDKFMNLKVV